MGLLEDFLLYIGISTIAFFVPFAPQHPRSKAHWLIFVGVPLILCVVSYSLWANTGRPLAETVICWKWPGLHSCETPDTTKNQFESQRALSDGQRRDDAFIRLVAAIKDAERPSTVFTRLCYGTQVNLGQIIDVAQSLGWAHVPISDANRQGGWNESWAFEIGGSHLDLSTFDDGTTAMCTVMVSGGPEQPVFTEQVISALGLKKVDPSLYRTTYSAEATVFSRTGMDDPSLNVILANRGRRSSAWARRAD